VRSLLVLSFILTLILSCLGFSFFNLYFDFCILIFFPLFCLIFLYYIGSKNLSMNFSSGFFFFLFICFLNIWLFYDKQFFGFFYGMLGPFLFAFDGFSIGMLSLTSLIFFLCSLFLGRYSTRPFLFLYLLFVMAFSFFFLFSILNIFFFYVFFEFVSFLLFIVVVIWGSRVSKVRASLELLYYTLVTSALLFVLLVFLFTQVGSFEYFELLDFCSANFEVQVIYFSVLFIFFAVKMPIVPFSFVVTKSSC
jgi:NADH-quinone oxidoreductase subunit M